MYYFTYGTSEGFPFRGGWTEVEAPDMETAVALFRAVHPDSKPGLVNCAFIYSEEKFRETGMAQDKSNWGAKCHERISITAAKTEDQENPNNQPELHVVLGMSTGHLSSSTREYLDLCAVSPFPGPTTYKKEDDMGEYGWWVRTYLDDPSDLPDEIPDDLQNCIQYAYKYNADWIMFDADAKLYGDLPVMVEMEEAE